MAHERLGEVLSTLKSVLQKYPPLNSTEIFSAAAALIGKIKSKKKASPMAERLRALFLNHLIISHLCLVWV